MTNCIFNISLFGAGVLLISVLVQYNRNGIHVFAVPIPLGVAVLLVSIIVRYQRLFIIWIVTLKYSTIKLYKTKRINQFKSSLPSALNIIHYDL